MSLLCRTFVVSNAIQTIDNYLLFEIHLTRRKFAMKATYKQDLNNKHLRWDLPITEEIQRWFACMGKNQLCTI